MFCDGGIYTEPVIVTGPWSLHHRLLAGGNDHWTWENPAFRIFFTGLNNNRKEYLKFNINRKVKVFSFMTVS